VLEEIEVALRSSVAVSGPSGIREKEEFLGLIETITPGTLFRCCD
jgi:hypothetical protein